MHCTEALFWPAFLLLVPWKLWYGQVGGKGLKCTSSSHPSTELGRGQDLHLDPEAGKLCQIPQYSHRLSGAQEDRETISVMQLSKRQNVLLGCSRGGISNRDKEALMPWRGLVWHSVLMSSTLEENLLAR